VAVQPVRQVPSAARTAAALANARLPSRATKQLVEQVAPGRGIFFFLPFFFFNKYTDQPGVTTHRGVACRQLYPQTYPQPTQGISKRDTHQQGLV
jgi:hypothetical protein